MNNNFFKPLQSPQVERPPPNPLNPVTSAPAVPGSQQATRSKKKRTGKKKRGRRKSFAVLPEESHDEAEASTAAVAARPEFYLQTRNFSNASLDSQTLLDHRDQQPLRPRRGSTMATPGSFQTPPASRLRVSHAHGGDSGDEGEPTWDENAPLLSRSAQRTNTMPSLSYVGGTSQSRPRASWAFGKGENVEQCTREHYAERLDEQRAEGCRIEGGLRVNKVVGNFHLAPGRSFSNGNMHVHDLKNYWDGDITHDFTHQIHALRFGPQLPESITKNLGNKATPWTNHHLNPLDGTSQITTDPSFNFMYFVKIVPTSYLPLGWDSKRSPQDHDGGLLGSFGQGSDGSIETHQYSVTSHKRSLSGGDDSAEGHAERLHTRGGIPGVFFSYDISPMKVINREERSKSFTGFLTGLCAVIGGTLTVAAAVDRGMFEGSLRLKKIRSKDN
ncbi:hypothetical protein BN1723_013873 [Verticillium longisporum]|uniref:Endoplasmic reticulum-Golgi intermediate compartment protein n=1 Tax=Verticillium longisporum TaxID=100787 RepID=A0A0G4LXI0_VERLO|nr:hypothetical protein BN1723_013873 [Verticillium longisporum]